VIGSWPREPDLAARENLADLETVAGGPLAGLLAEGSGSLPREAFRAAAFHGLGRSLGGLGHGHGHGHGLGGSR
jgi:dethiobiotin synthetase